MMHEVFPHVRDFYLQLLEYWNQILEALGAVSIWLIAFIFVLVVQLLFIPLRGGSGLADYNKGGITPKLPRKSKQLRLKGK